MHQNVGFWILYGVYRNTSSKDIHVNGQAILVWISAYLIQDYSVIFAFFIGSPKVCARTFYTAYFVL